MIHGFPGTAGHCTPRWPAALLVATMAIAACGRGADPAPAVDDSVVVTVATAARQTLRDVIIAAGTAVPAASADQTVYAPEPATIAELPKADGEPVAVGDVLVRFDIPSVAQDIAARQNAVIEANQRVAAAQAEVDKFKPLMDQGLIARVEFEKRTSALLAAQSAAAQAKSQLDIAELQRDGTVVRARFAGVVAGRWHNPGDVVVPGTLDPIIRVIDPTQIQIALQLSRTEADRVRTGLPATVTLADSGAIETATVAFAPMVTDPAATTVEVRLAPQAGSALAANAAVRVEIVADERRDVLAVPDAAIKREPNGAVIVMVVGDDGVAHRREIRVGLSAGQNVQIIAGLEPGDRVITTALDLINDGTRVRAK